MATSYHYSYCCLFTQKDPLIPSIVPRNNIDNNSRRQLVKSFGDELAKKQVILLVFLCNKRVQIWG